ncbi:MAG: hypothetical protein CL927_00850 [Deltaproteobacteria bacterium]|nr:hypothetical protein [Deltaproteobacteria bacterium]
MRTPRQVASTTFSSAVYFLDDAEVQRNATEGKIDFGEVALLGPMWTAMASTMSWWRPTTATRREPMLAQGALYSASASVPTLHST